MGLGVTTPFWLLTLIGVGVFLFALTRPAAAFLSWRQAFALGALAWTVARLVSLVWFWSVYPFDWLGVESHFLQLLAILVYWLIAASSLGVGGGVVALGMCWLKRRPAPWWWLTALLWVVGEIIGSFVFSVVTWAPEMALNINFSFGYVGYALASHAGLLQLAAYGGVYLLSLVSVLLVLTTLVAFKSFLAKHVWQGLTVVFVVLLFSSQAPIPPESSKGITVGIISTNFSASELATPQGREMRAKALPEAVRSASELKVDYLLLPEDARFTAGFASEEMAAGWYRFGISDPPSLIDSGYVSDRDSGYLRAYVYQDNQIHTIDKQYLVPLGEYLPTLFAWGLRLSGQGDVVEKINNQANYRPGPMTEFFPSNVPGILFCFDAVSPFAVKRLTNETEVPFISHVQSHAWFNEPESLWHQLDAMLRTQAVWSQVPIISAGNMVNGKVYYPNGSIIVVPTEVTTEKYTIGNIDL